MEMLQAPVMFHQFDGEPVEQLGMRRRRAFAAEIEDRGDERLAEVASPEMIYRHAGRERIVPIGDPLCERGSPAGARGWERFGPRRIGLEIVFLGLERATRDCVRVA